MPTHTTSWIAGWGMPLDWWQATAESLLPQSRHSFHLPGESAARAALQSDLAVGWSLGALYLVEQLAMGLRPKHRVLLLAPFLSFCREHGCGGKHATSQLRWLRRWVERDRPGALADFYLRAGLGGVNASGAPETALLLEGLSRLEQPPTRESLSWALDMGPSTTAVVGSCDTLLDAEIIAKTIKGCRVIPQVGHSALGLLRACPEVLLEV